MQKFEEEKIMHLGILRRKGRRWDGRGFVCLVIVILVIGVTVVPLWLRAKATSLALPIFESMARSQVEKTVRENGERLMQTGNYGAFCQMQYSADGKVQGVLVNSQEVRRYAADLSATLERAFKNLPLRSKIRSGDIIFPKLFSGSGFYMTVKGSLYGGASVELSSSLEEGGLNQTLHRVELEVTAPLTLMVLGREEQITVVSKLLICETVIVGGFSGGVLVGQ